MKKTVLITGAAGSIGSEISKVLATECNCNLILMDRSESALFDLQQALELLNLRQYKISLCFSRTNKNRFIH
jgi:FlaA1/EpsC-like NDP-sugar epimerase